MRKILPILFLLNSFFLFAQKVIVLDAETKIPIELCTVSGENNSNIVHTNKNGTVDLSIFEETDIITFKHLSYVEVDLLKRHLKQVDFTIYLHKKAEFLEEVILSSSKQKEYRGRIAEQVEVSRLVEISKMAPQTSADLLAHTPGVKVQKSQFGGGSPVLRGMEANKILLVIDGVRMNNAIYRSGHLQSSITVSPSALERMEVTFGPSSVIYGSDALGGVIHFYTKSPKLSEEEKIKASFLSRYSTVNNEFTNQGSVGVSFKKWASFTSVSYAAFDDLKMGENRSHGYDDWGKVFEYSNNTNTYYNSDSVTNDDPNVQKNTGYNQLDVLQKFIFKLNEKQNLSVNFQHSESSDIPRFDKLTEKDNGELKYAEWYYGPQKRTMISTQLDLHPYKSWIEEGVLTAAYQNIEESRIQRKFNSLDRFYRIENVDVFSFNGDFSVPLSENSNRSLSYGVEAAHNIVGSNSIGKSLDIIGTEVVGFSGEFPVQSRYPDGGSTYSNAALYTSYRQDVSKKGTLNTGVRYTRTWLHAKWIDDSFITLPDSDIFLRNGALTATAGYAYKPNKKWQFNGVLSSGFRSPNIDDIGKIREKNGKVTVPNIDLKPEYVYNAEFGTIRYLKDRRFNFGLNIYYTLLHNYIAREPFLVDGSPTIIYDGEEVETYANVNKNEAYIVGSTFSFNGKLSKLFSTQGSLTYTKGNTYDTKIPLSSIPPLFGDIGLIYAKNKFETALHLQFNAAKKVEDYNMVEGVDNIEQAPINPITGDYVGTPSWQTLNFRTRYKLAKETFLQFKIDNIFDQHYKEFASGINAPGRNFSFSILIN
ncbi:MAG: TonB-dependent receptor [Flavobacteriaceae bacterium]|nr:TonB-dependent receptor [Flavobacteriaceae bacterium]